MSKPFAGPGPDLFGPELTERLRELSRAIQQAHQAQLSTIARTQAELIKSSAGIPEIKVPEGILRATTTIKVPDGFPGAHAIKIPDGLVEALRSKPLTEGLRRAVEGLFPANWPKGTLSRLTEVQAILEEDGIPIIHVPRAEIVTALLNSATASARYSVLENHAEEIAEDCSVALGEAFHSNLSAQIPLARAAVSAFQAGHREAAHALAVLVCDTYLKTYLDDPRKQRVTYKDMAKAVAIDKTLQGPISLELNILYAFAPVAPFLAEWWPNDQNPTPPPTNLSRHVSVHNVSVDHYTPLNATLAIMLLTSLTVAIDRMQKHQSAKKATTP